MSAAAARAAQPKPLTATAIFKARAEACALLWYAGEYELHEAVDRLQLDAGTSGLVAAIGQDQVQSILAAAFGVIPRELPPETSDPWNSPSWKRAAVKYHHDRKGRVLAVEPPEPEELARLNRVIDGKAAPSAAPRGTAASVLDAAAWLWFQVGDVRRFQTWLRQHADDERANIIRHIRTTEEKRHAKNER